MLQNWMQYMKRLCKEVDYSVNKSNKETCIEYSLVPLLLSRIWSQNIEFEKHSGCLCRSRLAWYYWRLCKTRRRCKGRSILVLCNWDFSMGSDSFTNLSTGYNRSSWWVSSFSNRDAAVCQTLVGVPRASSSSLFGWRKSKQCRDWTHIWWSRRLLTLLLCPQIPPFFHFPKKYPKVKNNQLKIKYGGRSTTKKGKQGEREMRQKRKGVLIK